MKSWTFGKWYLKIDIDSSNAPLSRWIWTLKVSAYQCLSTQNQQMELSILRWLTLYIERPMHISILNGSSIHEFFIKWKRMQSKINNLIEISFLFNFIVYSQPFWVHRRLVSNQGVTIKTNISHHIWRTNMCQCCKLPVQLVPKHYQRLMRKLKRFSHKR